MKNTGKRGIIVKIGIIDIGSNTIRLVVYDIKDENFHEIINERYFAGLIEYVENDVLSYEGIDRMMEALKSVKELAYAVRCDRIYCFATASMRGLKNESDILFKVKNELKFDIDIISASEEVFYDYAGIKKNIEANKGMGLDLGGGSCQVFSFANGKITHSDSFKIGSLFIYKNFVDGLLPTKKEIKNIKEFVKKQLKSNKSLKNVGHDTIYSVGGSARAAAKLHRAMIGGMNQVSEYQLSCVQLNDMVKTIYNMDVKGVSFICHVIPERVYTIVPGLIILQSVCKYTGAKGIQTVKSSVREGYLWEKILKESYLSTEN